MAAFNLKCLNDHMQYLQRVQAALEGASDFKGCAVHECRLGQWLERQGEGECVSTAYQGAGVLVPRIEEHRRFHSVSNVALNTSDDAERRASSTELHQLSGRLVAMLLKPDEQMASSGTS